MRLLAHICKLPHVNTYHALHAACPTPRRLLAIQLFDPSAAIRRVDAVHVSPCVSVLLRAYSATVVLVNIDDACRHQQHLTHRLPSPCATDRSSCGERRVAFASIPHPLANISTECVGPRFRHYFYSVTQPGVISSSSSNSRDSLLGLSPFHVATPFNLTIIDLCILRLALTR
uniref:Uncharacterized protein n=1 Tax=Setaria digitata TaxID=48799 RepID=A0A915PCB1_9BILA